jgi:hypothetical protein
VPVLAVGVGVVVVGVGAVCARAIAEVKTIAATRLRWVVRMDVLSKKGMNFFRFYCGFLTGCRVYSQPEPSTVGLVVPTGKYFSCAFVTLGEL